MAGFQPDASFGLLAPAKTPSAITRVNSEARTFMQMPEMCERLKSPGDDVLTSTPEEYAKTSASDIERWGRLVRRRGLSAD